MHNKQLTSQRRLCVANYGKKNYQVRIGNALFSLVLGSLDVLRIMQSNSDAKSI